MPTNAATEEAMDKGSAKRNRVRDKIYKAE